jgi:ABC-2 type transport system permease protein
VAGVLIRLKLATLRHSWRAGDTSMLWLGASVGLAIAAWAWYQAVSEEDAIRALELLATTFAVWGLIWLALPIMGGSGGDPLQPESFRLLPLSPRRLAIGLLGASAVGVLPLVTFVAFAGLVAVAARLGAGALVVSIVAIPASLAFVIALARVVVGAMGVAMESRLGLELAAVQYALVIALSFIWFPIGVVTAEGGTGADALDFLPSAGDLAQMVPTGWGAVAVESVGRGEWALALGALAGLLGLTAVLLLAWSVLLARRLRGVAGGPGRPFRPAPIWDGLGSAVVSASPVGAVVGKELRAWARHPRRTVELRVALWSALFLVVIPGLFGARGDLWPWAGAVIVVVAAVGYSNVYGMDGTSLWLTVLAPGSAGADVRGRQLAWLLAVGPLAVAITVVLTAASWDAAMVRWVLAILPALLGAAAGLGPLLALTMPAPLPERRGGDPLDLGDDPTTAGTLLVHGLLVFVGLPVLAAPAALAVWLLPSPANWLGALVGLATGALYAWGMGRVAVGYLARNGPEVLDRMRARPARLAPTPAAPVGKEGAQATQSTLVSTAVSLLVTVGVILLVPQGLVAIVFSLIGSDVRSWFVALYLPEGLQLAAGVLLGLLGAVALGVAWWLHRRNA